MPDLGWVTLGLGIAYGSMVGYLASLEVRLRRVQQGRGDA